jgi:nitrous oxidase accessory protein
LVRLIGAAGALVCAAALPAPAAEHAIRPGELGSALSSARPGDTLRLEAGVHPGPVTVAVAVRLEGVTGAVIDGGGRGVALTLAADGISVSGLTVRNSGDDLSSDDAALLLRESRGITVARCRVEARAFGIYLRGGGGHRIVANEVVADARAAPSRSRRGNGIHLWHTAGNEIRDNRIAGVRDGIYFSFAHENVIRGNEASDLRYGIHYMYSERNTLAGNRFRRCVGGIALMFSMRNSIAGNVSSDNRDFGILCLQIERSELRGNRVAGNGRGFFVEHSVGNRFVENRLEANGVGLFLTAGSEENVFAGNRFDGNLVQAYQHRRTPNAWSEAGRGNEWSDYTGFDWNGDGVGETPYRLQTSVSALLARRPLTRWFLMSPALALLDWWDAQVGYDPGALDPAPLVVAR